MEAELNKAYEYINGRKYYHLATLSAIAEKLIMEGKNNYAKQIKDAIDFFESNLK